MNRNTVIGIVVALVAILAISLFFAFRGGDDESVSRIDTLRVEQPNFVVEGAGLARVELWSVPTGTGVTERDNSKVGDMQLRTPNNAVEQEWVLAIPEDPILAVELFARGYDENDNLVGDVSLGTTGATELFDLIWGAQEVSVGLSVGDTTDYQNMSLEFVRVVADSRCPIDAVCIQEGDVTIEANLSSGEGGVAPVTATLRTTGSPYQYGGYYIEVTRVEPSMTAAGEIAEDDYIITFTFSTDVKG